MLLTKPRGNQANSRSQQHAELLGQFAALVELDTRATAGFIRRRFQPLPARPHQPTRVSLVKPHACRNPSNSNKRQVKFPRKSLPVNSTQFRTIEGETKLKAARESPSAAFLLSVRLRTIKSTPKSSVLKTLRKFGRGGAGDGRVPSHHFEGPPSASTSIAFTTG